MSGNRKKLSTSSVRPSRRSLFVTHLECSHTGEWHAADRLHGLSKAGKPLLVRYDLNAVREHVTRDSLRDRAPDMWRYREFLPMPCVLDIVSLGEFMTPLIRLSRIQKHLGAAEIIVKDEGRLPSGSFKARGMAMAVTMAKVFGKTRLAVPTAGNAGAAAAAYGSRAGMETFVFTPEDTPDVTAREIGYHVAKVYLVNGLVNDCARIVRGGTEIMGWHDLSTLEEPYRIEGKKTMGLELAEQLGWDVPDVIYYPTGGGTGFIGMWKAFAELEGIAWLGSRRPRMVAVQSTGCAPIVKAFEQGRESVDTAWEHVSTQIHGVRVPRPIGDRLILRIIRESSGHAVAVSDEAAVAARAEVARDEGLHLCPEGAICYDAYKQDLAGGRVSRDERVVLFNTASGLKYPVPPVQRTLDCTKPIDYGTMV